MRRSSRVSKAQIEAFNRGVEAMRKLAADATEISPAFNARTTVGIEYAERIRRLPAPEFTSHEDK